MARRDQQDERDDRPELLDGDREALERVARAGALERVDEHAPAQPDERAGRCAAWLTASSRSARRPLAADQLDEQLLERARAGRRAGADLVDRAPARRSGPCAMTPMCVDRRSTISRMCEVRNTVPPRATNECSSSLICREATASIPSNGSSRKSSFGAGSSAAASASFFFMPCEKSATSVVAALGEIHQRQQVRRPSP